LKNHDLGNLVFEKRYRKPIDRLETSHYKKNTTAKKNMSLQNKQ
jgi:hypothetical protein